MRPTRLLPLVAKVDCGWCWGSIYISLYDPTIISFSSSRLHSFSSSHTFFLSFLFITLFTVLQFSIHTGRSKFFTLFLNLFSLSTSHLSNLKTSSIPSINMYTQTVLIALLASVADARYVSGCWFL